MAVAPGAGMREAALTPSGSDRFERRRDSRSAPAGDAPAGDAPAEPTPELLLFPPEPEVTAPRRRVRAPLRVRRSAGGEDRATSSRLPRGAAPTAKASPPTGGRVRFRPARPGVRLAAGCCDLALLAGLDALVVWLTLRLAGLDLQSLGALPLPPVVAFLCLLDAGYVAGLTAAGGQTIGKMAWGLRVADADGGPVSLPRALARTLWTPLSVTLGAVWMFLDREGRGLHDILSGTRVTAVPPPPGPAEGGTA